MAVGIISDIHGNIEALEVVVSKLHELGVDRIGCLGDIVGYGPNPNETVELVKQSCDFIVIGNHDAFVANCYPDFDFVGRSWGIVTETTKDLSKANKEFLKSLKPKIRTADIIFVHGNPAYPRPHCIRDYLLADMELRTEKRIIPGTDPIQARCMSRYGLAEVFECLTREKRKKVFVGHTHLGFASKRLPIIGEPDSEENLDKITVYMIKHNIPADKDFFELELDPDSKYIFNPGSVGQPRDLDNRASFMVIDRNKATWYRCAYDYEKTMKKLSVLKIPDRYKERISEGK